MRFVPKNLTVRVLIGLVLGVLFGCFFPDMGAQLKFLPDFFIRLIKLVIAPIIFLTVSLGIGGMEDMKKLGRIGGKAFLYFEIVSTFSLALGLVVVYWLQPGAGFDLSHVHAVDISTYTKAESTHGLIGFFGSMIPDNLVAAFAKGEMLPILLVSVLFGLAIARIGAPVRPLIQTFERLNRVFFGIVELIMCLSPVAVFGAMAYTIGKFGLVSLLPLGKLVASGYLTMALFVVLVLGAIGLYFKFNIFKVLRYIKEEIFLVLGTASSETALPTLMEKLQKAGCSKSVVGLVIPTGYSFNLDGTSIYLAMSVLFIAQAYHVPLTLFQLLYILGIMMLTSKGAAAVPGSGFITLAATLASMPGQLIPVAGIALLLGVDRFMSEARSVTNLIGNTVATVVVAKMEGEFLDQGAF